VKNGPFTERRTGLTLRDTLQKSASVIVAHQTGITVAEATQLRRDMRGAGAEFKVLKNTLAQIAIQGTPLEGIRPYLQGPTALRIFSRSCCRG
jgi:large subunit ribosomal protein L10